MTGTGGWARAGGAADACLRAGVVVAGQGAVEVLRAEVGAKPRARAQMGSCGPGWACHGVALRLVAAGAVVASYLLASAARL